MGRPQIHSIGKDRNISSMRRRTRIFRRTGLRGRAWIYKRRLRDINQTGDTKQYPVLFDEMSPNRPSDKKTRPIFALEHLTNFIRDNAQKRPKATLIAIGSALCLTAPAFLTLFSSVYLSLSTVAAVTLIPSIPIIGLLTYGTMKLIKRLTEVKNAGVKVNLLPEEERK